MAQLGGTGQGLLTATAVLALMILPTVALTAEVALAAVPSEQLQGAAALGLGRWAIAKGVAIPSARRGIGAGMMLATARALGETMAVLMVAGNVVAMPTSLTGPVRTLTANIASEMAYASADHRSVLFVSGLLLMAAVGVIVLGILLGGIALLIVAVLTWILIDIAWRGWSHLSWEFLTGEVEASGKQGGIAPLIVSTLAILGVALAVAVPLSLAAAIWLVEHTRTNSTAGRWIRVSLDALAAVPSIVFGLFGNAFFCVLLGMEYSILSGGLTLACMLLPIVTRVSEEALRAVPHEYRL
ncbi:pstC, partial [Symbiodinium microadriaticum]